MDKMFWVPIVSIVCLTIILVVAMVLGKNGIVLAGGCTAIAGLGGYEVKAILNGYNNTKKKVGP